MSSKKHLPERTSPWPPHRRGDPKNPDEKADSNASFNSGKQYIYHCKFLKKNFNKLLRPETPSLMLSTFPFCTIVTPPILLSIKQDFT